MMGIPQRSILGAFLFVTYINDIPSQCICDIVAFVNKTYFNFKVDRKKFTHDDVNGRELRI